MTMNPFYFWYRYIFWLMITFILIIYQEAQWPHLSNNSIHPNQICFRVLLYRISGSAWTIYQSRSFTNKTRAGFQNFSPYILMLNINPLLFLVFFFSCEEKKYLFFCFASYVKIHPTPNPRIVVPSYPRRYTDLKDDTNWGYFTQLQVLAHYGNIVFKGRPGF